MEFFVRYEWRTAPEMIPKFQGQFRDLISSGAEQWNRGRKPYYVLSGYTCCAFLHAANSCFVSRNVVVQFYRLFFLLPQNCWPQSGRVDYRMEELYC